MTDTLLASKSETPGQSSKRIALFYTGEAYQAYHSAGVAFELAGRLGYQVDIVYGDKDIPAHIERLRKALGGPVVPMIRYQRSPLLAAVQGISVLGFWKEQVMRETAGMLDSYDAVICSENTDSFLRKVGLRRPLLILVPHGAGSRAVSYLPETADFDFVLPPGEHCAQRMLAEKLIRPGHYAVPGYCKFDSTVKLYRDSARLFANQRPVVLYNPHRERILSSWPVFIEPILEYFSKQDEFNLIVAPHVKMFRRLPERVRQKWRDRGTANIVIDPGSWSSVDNTYTMAASIYLGDVSSQVYEFLAVPRPCIFLNPSRANWKDNKDFMQWHLGDVIETPAELPAALRQAQARHALYARQQAETAARALGDVSPGALVRAADAIHDYLRKARP